MPYEIKPIDLSGINCFLIRTEAGYIMVDTGYSRKSVREKLDKELENAACKPGDLKLVILTHGDHDHAGNCVYLRDKYAAKIAMHRDDLGMVERGDMNWNRKAKPDKYSFIFKVMGVMSAFIKLDTFETFTPDVYVDDGFDLSAYGFDATIVHIPGHSKGSIGVLASGGELICGDLFYNMFGKPDNYFVDDLADYNASVEKLRKLPVDIIYPGHGKAFRLAQL